MVLEGFGYWGLAMEGFVCDGFAARKWKREGGFQWSRGNGVYGLISNYLVAFSMIQVAGVRILE